MPVPLCAFLRSLSLSLSLCANLSLSSPPFLRFFLGLSFLLVCLRPRFCFGLSVFSMPLVSISLLSLSFLVFLSHSFCVVYFFHFFVRLVCFPSRPPLPFFPVTFTHLPSPPFAALLCVNNPLHGNGNEHRASRVRPSTIKPTPHASR